MLIEVNAQRLRTTLANRKWLATLTLWAAMAWAFTQLQLPGNSLFLIALHNAGHGLAFALVTFLAIRTFQADFFNWPGAIGICLLLSLLGVFIEFVQHSTGREASFSDLLMNSIGMFSGLAASRIRRRRMKSADDFSRQSASSTGSAHSSGQSLIWAVLAILALTWCLHKPAWYLLANFNAKPLPILMDFEPWTSDALLETRNAVVTTGDHATIWMGNHSQSARVDFKTGSWPSIRFLEPARDWRGFSAFEFRVFNPGNDTVPLRIRIDDASIRYPDHSFMTVSREVPVGESLITVSFRELADEARKRGTAHFDSVTKFLFFISRNDERVTLLFDDIRLR